METNEELKTFNTKIIYIETRLVQVEKVQNQVDLIQTHLEKFEEDASDKEQWVRMNYVEIEGLSQRSHENLLRNLDLKSRQQLDGYSNQCKNITTYH